MKKYLPDMCAIAFILCIVSIFFFPFFFPEPKLLVTPDFGRSDSWHFSIPTKFLLWKSLQHNTLPLWVPELGGGFPLFAEGQVGALFPLNLILFKLFDFAIAYNLALASTVFVFSVGTYFFLDVMTKSRLGALLGATAIALSGIVIPQLPHISLLQGLSLMPWILLATTALPRFWWLSILVAFQIFAGFPQATFITLLFAAGYVLWQKKGFVAFLCAVFLGIALAGIQIVPSLEFLHQSSQPTGFSADVASYYSYPWKHLITLVKPFALGNPKEGTYPHFAAFDGSIFWENSGFVGLVPLIFALISLARGSSTFFLVTCLMSLFLMTGSHSPLYLIYSFWPFNLFRVPSRFIWVFVLSILVLSSLRISKIRSKFFLVLLILLNTAQLWTTWQQYHALVPAKEWLAAPKTLASLTPNGKFYTVGVENTPLLPDSNVLWNYASTHVYAGRFLARSSYIEALLHSQIDTSNHIATISAFGEKLLSLTGTTDLVTAWQPDAVTIVKKSNALPRQYIANNPVLAKTFTEAAAKLKDASFMLGQSVLVHRPIEGNQEGKRVFVSTDTYYPGWHATVDGKEANIVPVNISQRGVFIPEGDHRVVFTYQPDSLKVGAAISFFASLFILLLVGYPLFPWLFRRHP
ncbi:YfhO family protein [Candidatus Gottesmanbacteria bacterium]|nr:YfhO family protein [Candidatus Gottesmanbacteria bacterium]